ncbi:MAG: hypothetical protein WC438_05330, partial [Candidatus Pacearchaeota archaeon]
LNVQMLFDEYGYCPYCFDGIKNYDEDEIDCTYSGKSCPVCNYPMPLLGQTSSVYFIFTILGTLCFVFLVWYLFLWNKYKKRKKRILGMSKL